MTMMSLTKLIDVSERERVDEAVVDRSVKLPNKGMSWVLCLQLERRRKVNAQSRCRCRLVLAEMSDQYGGGEQTLSPSGVRCVKNEESIVERTGVDSRRRRSKRGLRKVLLSPTDSHRQTQVSVAIDTDVASFAKS